MDEVNFTDYISFTCVVSTDFAKNRLLINLDRSVVATVIADRIEYPFVCHCGCFRSRPSPQPETSSNY